ncbi:UDP-glycosyltransferase 73B4-like [Cryptomeria japonica]|uniref:UDP-glycosyltransferase 73B4-like n=1 Tax=Cryptomeria japonica TaxID=3369 RepID=UPI0027DA779B|nr:UDP-glycosyltransferase 73B4-like [Cryptomeria japonica]
MADIPTDELVQWLDSRRTGSVVYVSFGSMVKLSKEQTKALARGLEGSKQHFVWTIKVMESGSSGNAEFLPEGFVERTKDRGVVIWSWAPKLLILSHPSVGGIHEPLWVELYA